MSWENAKEVVKTIETTVRSLSALQQLTQVGGADAGAVLKVIDSGLTFILEGLVGKMTTKDVEDELKALIERVTQNDADADKILHDKFDPGGEG